MSDIDHKTRIPLFAVLCSLPFLIGAILWMADTASNASSARADMVGVKEILVDLQTRTIRIEELLKYLKKQK